MPDASPDNSTPSAVPTEKVIEELSALPKDEQRRVITAVTHIEAFSGPLPSPDAFERYNQVVPDAGNRILAMAEREQEIRQEAQRGAIANDRRKIDAATILGLGMLVVAGLATWFGQIWIALPIGLAGVITTLARLVLGRPPRSSRQ